MKDEGACYMFSRNEYNQMAKGAYVAELSAAMDLQTRFTHTIQVLCQSINDGEIDALYLFGSFARGDAKEISDIDLIVVSDLYPDFSQYLRKRIFLKQYGQGALLRIDPICMTSAEFRKYRNSDTYAKEKLIRVFGVAYEK